MSGQQPLGGGGGGGGGSLHPVMSYPAIQESSVMHLTNQMSLSVKLVLTTNIMYGQRISLGRV